MFKFWKKDKAKKEESGSAELTWSKEAQQALDQAVSGAPVPALLKNTLKKQLTKAAEQEAAKAGHNEVTPEDLMQGLMANLPAEMKNQVEQAMKQGPEGLKRLEKTLKKKK